MGRSAGDVVRGRQGPRKPAGNLYPVKRECACPRPMELERGECTKCGHAIRRGER